MMTSIVASALGCYQTQPVPGKPFDRRTPNIEGSHRAYMFQFVHASTWQTNRQYIYMVRLDICAASLA